MKRKNLKPSKKDVETKDLRIFLKRKKSKKKQKKNFLEKNKMKRRS